MRLLRAWEQYWFRPAPLFNLGFVRLVAVGYQLYHLATLRPRILFGELAALPESLYQPLVVMRVLTLPFGTRYRPPEDVVVAIYWLTLSIGILAFIGWFTRFSLLLFTAGSVFLQAFEYSFTEVHHAEAIVMITLAMLALSPSGAALSFDDLRRRLRAADRGGRELFDSLSDQSRFARWPLLVVQWMFALIYLSAAFHKLLASGLDWMNGWTLQYYMLMDGMRWGNTVSGAGPAYSAEPSVALWIGQYHTLATIASWGSMLFESTFWLAVVLPPLMPVYLLVGTAFHVAIYYIQRAPFLSFVWLYAVFVPWDDVFRRLGVRIAGHLDRPVRHYDPASRRGVRKAMLIRYFDWVGLTIFSARVPPVEGPASTKLSYPH